MTTATASIASRAASYGTPTTLAAASREEEALRPAIDQAIADDPVRAVEALSADRNGVISVDVALDLPVIEVDDDTPVTGVETVDRRKVLIYSHGGRLLSTHRSLIRTPSTSVLNVSRFFYAENTRCWATHTTTDYVGVSTTVWVAWRRVTENGWCGNGVTVTTADNPSYASEEIPTYCWNDVEHNQGFKAGPDAHVWWHAQNYAQLGGDPIVDVVCVNIGTTVAPSVEVKGNGYWDHGF